MMLSASALPDIALISAHTVDSKGVTIDYRIDNTNLSGPLSVRVERSVDTQTHNDDVIVGTVAIAASQLDDQGKLALSEGEHQITLSLQDGLPPIPAQPDVVVTIDANQTVKESNEANNTASFHKYSVAVITHGGLQLKSWKTNGPPWVRHLAARLKDQGFDKIVAYNWVSESGTPGSAAKQGPRLANVLTKTINGLDTTDPVDVQFIGHSEGTVVNSEAIRSLNRTGWPAATDAGFLKVTMLDPHAANNGVKGQQYSVSNGFLGWLAKTVINDYQARADDPPPIVTPNVDLAEVYFQHTPVTQTRGSNHGIYNLWGQVPVRGNATYYNLTAPGISHSGKFSVQDWYSLNVAPTIGVGSPTVESQALSAEQVGEPVSALAVARPYIRRGPVLVDYAGRAAPDTTVTLLAGRLIDGSKPGDLHKVGETTSDAQGNWQITTRAIAAGRYRMFAEAGQAVSSIGRRSPLKPTVFLPPLVT